MIIFFYEKFTNSDNTLDHRQRLLLTRRNIFIWFPLINLVLKVNNLRKFLNFETRQPHYFEVPSCVKKYIF